MNLQVRFMRISLYLLLKYTCIIIPCLDEIVKYLQYVKTLGYTDEPNYSKCKDFFVQALKKHGWKNDGKLDFTAEKKTAAKPVRTGLNW